MDQDQKNYLNLTKYCDPTIMVVDFEDLANRIVERRAAQDKANPTFPEDARTRRVEYSNLRKELFAAQEWAKNAEIYCNDRAGTVKLLEQRITELLKQKNAAVEAGNLRGERTLEHGIQLLETELVDAKTEFHRAKIQSGNAGRGLKAFAGHERMKELKAELGIA